MWSIFSSIAGSPKKIQTEVMVVLIKDRAYKIC